MSAYQTLVWGKEILNKWWLLLLFTDLWDPKRWKFPEVLDWLSLLVSVSLLVLGPKKTQSSIFFDNLTSIPIPFLLWALSTTTGYESCQPASIFLVPKKEPFSHANSMPASFYKSEKIDDLSEFVFPNCCYIAEIPFEAHLTLNGSCRMCVELLGDVSMEHSIFRKIKQVPPLSNCICFQSFFLLGGTPHCSLSLLLVLYSVSPPAGL